jgi:nucleoside-diphosphate-sugar epimerase
MRILVTGATGFVGSAVVSELLAARHDVVGMARSDAGARALQDAGAQVLRCELTDLEGLRRGADASDGVIHTAFIHDFANFAQSCAIDRAAIEAMGAALAGSARPLVVSSGTGLLAPGGIATEETVKPEGSPIPRMSEEAALEADRVRGVVVRLPPSVHGAGDHGFVPILIRIAREKGFAAYIGEGGNHWPAVHRTDAAQVYRRALERGVGGMRYHATAEEGVPFRDIATAIGRGLNVPVRAISPEEASDYFGWFALFAGIDNRASSAWTREVLEWTPSGPGLIADIDHAGYFG